MKERIRKILVIVVFCFLTGYLFVHVSYIFRDSLSITREILTGYYAEKRNSLDVVFVGSSPTFSAFMPMELWREHGVASYVFATNMQFEDSMLYSLKEMRSSQHPQVVVIDTVSFLLGHRSDQLRNDENYLRYNTDGYRFSLNRIQLIHKIAGSLERQMACNFDLSFYRTNRKPDLAYWNWKRHNPNKGWGDLPVHVSYRREEEITAVTEENPFQEEELTYLDEILRWAEDYDREVLFVILPYYGIDRQTCDRAHYLETRLEEEGFALLNLRDERDRLIDISGDYSLDHLHFHAASAKKITAYMGNYLKEHYQLPDHRGEKGYRKWEEDLSVWTEGQNQ